jgi:16S rRNA (adenine1518-N6/adenine1519-N6)-dimethyltransferase
MKAKKSLGQNFLKSVKALSDIVKAGNISASDTVLEIGPGKGALTEKLLETGAHVFAVEKDADLIPILQEKFTKEISEKRFVLIHDDILTCNPKELIRDPYKLVGNIPYYITGAIIRKFLESDYQPILAVFLVQKEVAERIVARDGKESILSLSVKAYGEATMIGKVPARYFTPEPKVDSAILLIDHISKKNFKNISEKDFFILIKLAFAQKRKTLMKNLKSRISVDMAELFKSMEISEKARAEDASLDQFLVLTKHLFPQSWETK